MSEKPLAARCVVPAIACKALSAREDSRVERSPGPWDRCSPLEARAELQKGSGSSTRCTGQSRGGTADAAHPINSQNQVVLGQLSAGSLHGRILFSPHLYCIHIVNSVDTVQGCKRQSFQPRARPGFFQVLKHLIVQNVGAFDASCNCSCGKEATELLPSVSHVLTYPCGWRNGSCTKAAEGRCYAQSFISDGTRQLQGYLTAQGQRETETPWSLLCPLLPAPQSSSGEAR